VSLLGPTPWSDHSSCPTALVAARRSVLVATTQSREDCPGTACAFRTGHVPRVCATTVAHQPRPPVEPVLSRAVEVPLRTSLAHPAWDAEHGDPAMSCTVLCAPPPCVSDTAVTQRAVTSNGDATAVAPRTSVTPGIRTLRPDTTPGTECIAQETVQPSSARSLGAASTLDEHDGARPGLVLAFAWPDVSAKRIRFDSRSVDERIRR